eukprot:CAMPEP_0206614398 /NCGR_PEP_ID=MMETSP0325_2-20121206/57369_1 /ASSEMBLY_ACC=CAM_ASM_000347 /TAXON_ID=2866 /ORGANISM="Crypthecodinium cohnii, Strain Seligo" /LENGTH=94 /DNA_ID=CAMNT_0054134889 /DNA_START=61 /DNA_END=341 /DNA_ORIENTATION=-
MGEWEVRLGADWQALGPEETMLLTDMAKMGRTSGDCHVRGHAYRFDLSALTQTNVATGKVRYIRRVPGSSPIGGSSSSAPSTLPGPSSASTSTP